MKRNKIAFLILCIIGLISCNHTDNIDKIIFRGEYNNWGRKPRIGDTLFLFKSQKDIDTVLHLLESANELKSVKPREKNDNLNSWYDISFYSNDNVKIKTSFRNGVDHYYFKHKGKIYDGKELCDFMVYKYQNGR